tara:strand:+ start:6447 stop:6929 length:483 start_codon:yes stop_codon:yes gene_type:complete
MAQAATQPRIRRPDAELVPRALVRAVAALVVTVFALVTFYVATDRPVISSPPQGGVVISRDVLLSGDLAGAATVTTPDGTTIADFSPEEGGFVAGVHRVILRERTKHRVALDGPVTLIGHKTGRTSIYDPSTGWSADLMGFGADNARTFARLLAQPEGGQ